MAVPRRLFVSSYIFAKQPCSEYHQPVNRLIPTWRIQYAYHSGFPLKPRWSSKQVTPRRRANLVTRRTWYMWKSAADTYRVITQRHTYRVWTKTNNDAPLHKHSGTVTRTRRAHSNKTNIESNTEESLRRAAILACDARVCVGSPATLSSYH